LTRGKRKRGRWGSERVATTKNLLSGSWGPRKTQCASQKKSGFQDVARRPERHQQEKERIVLQTKKVQNYKHAAATKEENDLKKKKKPRPSLRLRLKKEANKKATRLRVETNHRRYAALVREKPSRVWQKLRDTFSKRFSF